MKYFHFIFQVVILFKIIPEIIYIPKITNINITKNQYRSSKIHLKNLFSNISKILYSISPYNDCHISKYKNKKSLEIGWKRKYINIYKMDAKFSI